MNSGEVANWLGAGAAILSLVLFVIAEREKLAFWRKRSSVEGSSSPSVSLPVEQAESIRSAILPRIFLGIVLGFSINRVFLWLFRIFSTINADNIVEVKVSISAISAIVFGTLFGVIYAYKRGGIKSFFLSWGERTIVSFVVFSLMSLSYQTGISQAGNVILMNNPYASILAGALLISLITHPLPPSDYISDIYKNLKSPLKENSQVSNVVEVKNAPKDNVKIRQLNNQISKLEVENDNLREQIKNLSSKRDQIFALFADGRSYTAQEISRIINHNSSSSTYQVDNEVLAIIGQLVEERKIKGTGTSGYRIAA